MKRSSSNGCWWGRFKCQSVGTQTKVNMGLWRRDATRNTCITARAFTKMFTFNARLKQRKPNQHSCITDKMVDRISTRKLHFSEMCSKIVQYLTSSLNVGYLVLDEFNDCFPIPCACVTWRQMYRWYFIYVGPCIVNQI